MVAPDAGRFLRGTFDYVCLYWALTAVAESKHIYSTNNDLGSHYWNVFQNSLVSSCFSNVFVMPSVPILANNMFQKRNRFPIPQHYIPTMASLLTVATPHSSTSSVHCCQFQQCHRFQLLSNSVFQQCPPFSWLQHVQTITAGHTGCLDRKKNARDRERGHEATLVHGGAWRSRGKCRCRKQPMNLSETYCLGCLDCVVKRHCPECRR